MAPAALTPGKATVRPMTASAKRARSPATSYLGVCNMAVNINAPRSSKPRGSSSRRRTLSIDNPAATTSTIDSASWTTTKICCSRPRLGPSALRPPRRASAGSTRVRRIAGATPNTMPVSMEIATAKAKTRRSSDGISHRGDCPSTEISANSEERYASAVPSTPPANASMTLSVSS